MNNDDFIDSIVDEAMEATDKIMDRLEGTEEEEDARIDAIDGLNSWMRERGFREGELNCNLEKDGWCVEVLDLGWPYGISDKYDQRIAVQFYHTTPELLALAKEHGFVVYESIADFKEFVEKNCMN